MSEQFETVAKWLDKLHYAEADGKTNNKTGDIVTLGDIVSRGSRVKSCIKCIDDMTDDLLEIADVLEEHQVNVKLENGRYLNPVSAIHSKVDVIWDEVQTIAAWNARTDDYKQAAEYWQKMYEQTFAEQTCCDTGENEWHFVCSACGYEQNGYECWSYCPQCGRKVVDE